AKAQKADQLPPAGMTCRTRTKNMVAEIARMNGKRKRRRASHAAKRISRIAAIADHDHCRSEALTPFQPHHSKSRITSAAQAITLMNAKIPAAIGRSARRSM